MDVLTHTHTHTHTCILAHTHTHTRAYTDTRNLSNLRGCLCVSAAPFHTEEHGTQECLQLTCICNSVGCRCGYEGTAGPSADRGPQWRLCSCCLCSFLLDLDNKKWLCPQSYH